MSIDYSALFSRINKGSVLFQEPAKKFSMLDCKWVSFDPYERPGTRTQPFRHLLKHRQGDRLQSRQVNVLPIL